MDDIKAEIQAMVDREKAAWDDLDAEALVSLFHPDMIWPWPEDARAHDPVRWVFPMGRYERERWTAEWEGLFRTHELVHNRRETGEEFPWKGRACKGYTKVDGRWLMIFHTGLLDYGEV